MSEDELISIRKDSLVKFLKNKFSWIVFILLAVILWVNYTIRTLPMRINPSTGNPYLWDVSRNGWTLGPDLDPFLFMRYAKIIVEQGSLPIMDMLRYSPLGYNTLGETRLLPYAIAYFHKIINFFGDYSVEYAATFLPAVFSIFTAIAFFLLVRKIFERKGKIISNLTGLLATAFMVTLPSLLSRTIAGIPEKEALSFGLMFFAFYLFLSAWKANKLRNAIILSLLSGLFTAFMGLIWGGVAFIYSSLAIAVFITLIFGKIRKRDVMVYSGWIISSIVFWIPFTTRTSIRSFLTSSTTGAASAVLIFIFVYYVLYKTKLSENQFVKKISFLPNELNAILISVILMGILGSIAFGPSTIWGMISDLISKLIRPFDNRLSFTVAENRQPFFNEWRGSFGPVVRNIPLFFWMFFIGSLYLFYEMVKKLRMNEKLILVGSYLVFLLALIFSRTSPSSIFNGSSFQSVILYGLGYVVLVLGFSYVIYNRKKNNEFSIFKKFLFEYIFVFGLVFIGIIAARSAVRLIMVLAPIATISLSYLVVISVANAFKSFKKKGDVGKILLILFAVLLLLVAPYTLYYNYEVSKATANNHVPSTYTHQWQRAMGWVRENTPQDAVFGHWWDYGYWVQTMGERATMLDGGNSISYWNYLMGRHVLTADNESEALELLWNHNVTHFLIDSTEIGKYSAYSNIGSDENYDKYSWIGIFIMDEKQTRETGNSTLMIYQGGIGLDEDLIIENNGQKALLPKQSAGVQGVIVGTRGGSLVEGFEQPRAVYIYNNLRYEVPLRYLFYDGELLDFGSGIEAAFYVFPRFDQGKGSVNRIGAGMYLSPRNYRALWVKLYLLEQEDNFKLVHSESNDFVKSLRNQLGDFGEIIYFNGVQGPIKIWEINYVGDEKFNEEYLARTFPERIASRNLA